ncbi:uncharacterized protein LOC106872518 [Octopus bimaculoides]|uniref:uncharacterized protein LOC106872518 n=1 Tax=Octopus bimaculoides TaxID=37653 RepID=UPI00071D47E4|nr:uncharacterized protein LOC106872518 [Octopus bimaculoides]|eukprot:XP_014775025.1 PREDICTED: uncharacterized protein LOC106872518 [Octopus bimaculoides]
MILKMVHYFKNILQILLIALGNEVIQRSCCSVENSECYPSLCDAESLQRRCSCHQYCNLYKECCSDVIGDTLIEHGTSSIDYRCKKINDDELDSYFLFDRCPSDHSIKKHVTYCETPDENDRLYNIPALGKRTKRLYRNLFCALCNGEEYILWTVHYKCNHKMDIDLSLFPHILRNNHCNVSIEAPLNFSDYQYPCTDYVSSCPLKVTNASLVSSCAFGPMAIVRSNGTNFRNIHCAICNGVDINDIDCNVTIFIEKSYNIKVYSRTVIFNYYNNTVEILNANNERDYLKEVPSCSHGFVYDEIKNECRAVDFSSILNCTTKRLKEFEYHFTSDGSLYLNSSQTLLNQSQFNRDPQGINICKNDSNDMIPGYIYAVSYIVLVGLVTSVLALSITVIVYLCIRELRTIPGKLFISYLSSLCIAEFLYLISQEIASNSMCIAFAVLKHYFSLAAFFWMNVMSFDSWYTFSGFTPLRGTEKNATKLIYYSIYAWICPLVIVTVSLIFQYAPGDNGLSPEYGKKRFCWITNIKFRLWFFSGPIIIILLLNILAFILTARGIYIVSKNSSKYLAVKSKKKLKIYLKLSLLMGIPWIFTLPPFDEIPEVLLTASIFNSFDGLLISIALLSTKKVRRYFRLKFSRHCYKCNDVDISTSSDY